VGIAPHHCSWIMQSGMLMNHVCTVPCSTSADRTHSAPLAAQTRVWVGVEQLAFLCAAGGEAHTHTAGCGHTPPTR
jgi:hypothetical protein